MSAGDSSRQSIAMPRFLQVWGLCIFSLQRCFVGIASRDAPDIVWTTLSANVSGSMPLGNGRVGVNAFSTKNNEVELWLSHTDAFDHFSNLVKVGHIVVKVNASVPDATFKVSYFSSNMTISFQMGLVLTHVWVDATSPVVRVESSGGEHSVQVELHRWKRFAEVDVDNVTDGIAWHHRIEPKSSPVWENDLKLEGLTDLMKSMSNPLDNITFGGFVNISTGARLQGHLALSAPPSNSHKVAIAIDACKSHSVDSFLKGLRTQALAKGDRAAHNSAWAAFHFRSFINVSSSTDPDNATLANAAPRVTLMDRIARSLFSAMSNSSHAIKFQNFGIFSALPAPHEDERDWGACQWFQNIRLPYYQMLASGDFESMKSLFKYYYDALAVSQTRTSKWFPNAPPGAAFFPEIMSQYGTYPQVWGPNSSAKVPDLPSNTYIRYHREGGLELSHLALNWLDHTGDWEYFEQFMLPQITAYVGYYAHFPRDPATGVLDIFPAQALETYQCPDIPPKRETCVTGPMPEIAGLRRVLPRLLALRTPANRTVGSSSDRALWSNLLQHLPLLPVGPATPWQLEVDKPPLSGPAEARLPTRFKTSSASGQAASQVLLPGMKFQDVAINTENPELYAVHPFQMVGLFANQSLGEATYRHRRFRANTNWAQDLMEAALLGLPGTESAVMLAERWADPVVSGYRFPIFQAGVGCTGPCTDHSGVSTAGLRYMLLQSNLEGEKVDPNTIVLFPSWPCRDWAVHFRLHAPGRTVLSGFYDGAGKLARFQVTPPHRRADVRFHACVKEVELAGEDTQLFI
eukprot:TRINITY_DN74697_c0_g1_i1.p1 TRINITY_DN74697_c0_g1~~TRINITY_DN74697_c0_g1_i1.p1  ORF type:complete len:802 (+),score=92.72 TRINITY_DN74697_c0_g1_i1:59-2464(+)